MTNETEPKFDHSPIERVMMSSSDVVKTDWYQWKFAVYKAKGFSDLASRAGAISAYVASGKDQDEMTKTPEKTS